MTASRDGCDKSHLCQRKANQASLTAFTTVDSTFRVDHKSEEDSKAYEAVKGSLSTKVEAVVKTLIKIRNDDPNAKALEVPEPILWE